MRATDVFGGPFTPPGFYYKTFIRPRRFWPLYEKVLRHAAGLGKLRKSQPEREWQTEYRRRHADVLVVGGGAAGLSAAIAAAELGADVVLADEGPEPGGRLLAEGGEEQARELAARAAAAGVELLTNAPALGAFDGLVPVWQGVHAAPGPRALPGLRDRRDRAAARLPGQRPAGRDALRRRPPAGRSVRRAAGHRAPSSRPSTTAASALRWRCSRPAWRWPASPTCARRARASRRGHLAGQGRRGAERRHGARGARAQPARRRRAGSAGGARMATAARSAATCSSCPAAARPPPR